MRFWTFVRRKRVIFLFAVVLSLWTTFAFGGAYDQLRQMGGNPPPVPEPRPSPVEPQPRPEREPRQPREPRERPSSPQRPSQQQQYQQQRIQEEKARAQAAKVSYGQGNECYKRRDWNCAIQNYEQALRNSPNNPKIKNALERARQEARKEQEQAERSRREKEQQQAFERGKKEVLDVVKTKGSQQQNLQRPPQPAGQDLAFGTGSSYRTSQRMGGLTEEEWKLARYYQHQIESLERNKKGIFLSGEELKLMDELTYKRNQLWEKAISVPGLTAEEKEKLKLKLYTSDLHATPSMVSSGQLQAWKDKPKGSPSHDSNGMIEIQKEFHTKQMERFIEEKGGDIAEEMFGEKGGKGYGNLLGVVRITMKTVKEDISSGISETVDFILGKLPNPRAAFAREAGKEYEGMVDRSLKKFMEDSSKAVGAEFDSKKFMEDIEKERKASLNWTRSSNGKESGSGKE